MTVLYFLQFSFPGDSWINKSPGGEISTGQVDNGSFRPHGTFSFITGPTCFQPLVLVFLLWFLLTGAYLSNKFNKTFLVSILCYIVSIPVLVSRTHLFQTAGICIIFVYFVFIVYPSIRARLFFILLSSLGIGIVVHTFSDIMDPIINRYTLASEIEGNTGTVLIKRWLVGYDILSVSYNLPFWGMGTGLGTNVGAKLTTNNVGFLLAEGELQRCVMESGILLGLIIVIVRVYMPIRFLIKSLKIMKKENDLLPFAMAIPTLILISVGLWATPTGLSFGILSGGLFLTSIKKYE
jgi:hypothetical protein